MIACHVTLCLVMFAGFLPLQNHLMLTSKVRATATKLNSPTLSKNYQFLKLTQKHLG